MEQIAAMFGKKLNEEFTIKYKDKCYKAYFKKNGIRVRGLYYMQWDNVLVGLLTGEVTIIDWVRIPKLRLKILIGDNPEEVNKYIKHAFIIGLEKDDLEVL